MPEWCLVAPWTSSAMPSSTLQCRKPHQVHRGTPVSDGLACFSSMRMLQVQTHLLQISASLDA